MVFFVIFIGLDEVNDQSLNCIENFSNECFYEIFDYLDGCEIYQAFSNLNSRFQQLINSSILLFKIKYDHLTLLSKDIFRYNYEQILVNNKHQIYSINISTMEDMFFTLSFCLFHASYDRLESLTIIDIKSNTLRLLLNHYKCLPRLFSLNINTETNYTLTEMTDIYQLIFALPNLKSFEFETDIIDVLSILPLSIASNQQFNNIKYLYIHHSCDVNELFAIISYTPQLCHLKLEYVCEDDESINANVSPISLSNLTHISIDRYETTFEKFQWFIKNIYCKLKFLYFNVTCNDLTCFDANQWEKLIQIYLPELKIFYLTYDEPVEYQNKIINNSQQINQFFSSFWIERQTILDIEIDKKHIKYVFRPYRYISYIFYCKINEFVCFRKQWYEYKDNNSVNSSIQLILQNIHSEETFSLLKIYIDNILTIGPIYHLEIFEVSIYMFIQILNLLFKLDSIKVSTLPIIQSRSFSTNEKEMINLISQKNQIKKVNLKMINTINEVSLILELCPRITYLKIDSINNIDIESFVRFILIKIKTICNHQLRLLCFCISAADDKMVKNLQTMIDSRNLLLNYTIKRILNNIYLEWK